MIKAPFTDDQVESINAYQKAGVMHPFTCGSGCGPDLVASVAALACPACGYRQDWVHGFMADWSWKPEPGSLYDLLMQSRNTEENPDDGGTDP